MSGDPADAARQRLVLACVAAGSLVAGAGLYWAARSALDYYIPYEARDPGGGRPDRPAARRSTRIGCPLDALRCARLLRVRRQTAPRSPTPHPPAQYHYRPGTLSGWLASALNKYSKRRRRERRAHARTGTQTHARA